MIPTTQVIVNASTHELPLPAAFFHTVVTSPPYFSLRSYQGQQEIDWPAVEYAPMPGIRYEWIVDEDGEPELVGIPDGPGEYKLTIPPMRCALGLEPTPEAYIGHLVACFREVWRVMRPEGVVWCVMGDSYVATTRGSMGDKVGLQGGWKTQEQTGEDRPDKRAEGLKQGDLMLIPARLALALQADGWVIRNDVVWAKVAPMPESVSGWRWERHQIRTGIDKTQIRKSATNIGSFNEIGGNVWERDAPQPIWSPCPGCSRCEATGGYVLRRGSWRHTRAHETVIMAVKSMGYYADQERVREPTADYDRKGGTATWECDGATTHGIGSDSLHQMSKNGRNPRSVLTPSPESYGRDHYAVYPSTLIAPLLRATAPTRVCPACGAPWAPVVERESAPAEVMTKRNAPTDELIYSGTRIDGQMYGLGQKLQNWRNEHPNRILGHRATCDCIGGYPGYRIDLAERLDPAPGWVLDPFVGSGTTLTVCRELGVNCVGVDLSPGYLDEHAKPRIGLTPAGALDTLPLFAAMEA